MDLICDLQQGIYKIMEDYRTQIRRNQIIGQLELAELREKSKQRKQAASAETLAPPWASSENPLNLSAGLTPKEFHADEIHHNTDEEEKKASLVADVPYSPRETSLQLLSGDDSPKSSIGDYGTEKSPTDRLLPKSALEQGEVGTICKVSLKGNSTAQVGGKSTVHVEFSPTKHKSELINFVGITLFNRKVGTQDIIVVENLVFDPGKYEGRPKLWKALHELDSEVKNFEVRGTLPIIVLLVVVFALGYFSTDNAQDFGRNVSINQFQVKDVKWDVDLWGQNMEFGDHRNSFTNIDMVQTNTEIHIVVFDEDNSLWPMSTPLLGADNVEICITANGKAASPAVSGFLESIPGVKVMYRTKDLEEQQAKSWIWNETRLSSSFYKPCNCEFFVKQSLNMEMALAMIRDVGMGWILHLDNDELIHLVGAREYSLRRLLLDVAENMDMVVFPNYESSVEQTDIQEPFTEVLMFKKSYDHLTKGTYFGKYKESTHGNPIYFLTHGNGKAAARIQDHLRPNAAHRWHSYMKTPNEIKLGGAAVLHYIYAKFSDVTSRQHRCGCKPTKEDVKRFRKVSALQKKGRVIALLRKFSTVFGSVDGGVYSLRFKLTPETEKPYLVEMKIRNGIEELLVIKLRERWIRFLDVNSPEAIIGHGRMLTVKWDDGKVTKRIDICWITNNILVTGLAKTGNVEVLELWDREAKQRLKALNAINDIDIVTLNCNVSNQRNCLQALSRVLSRRRITKETHVTAKAKDPIIKFVEKESDVAFYIRIDVNKGPKIVDYIRNVVSKSPPLKQLCLILKIFLQKGELKVVNIVGMGSYAFLSMLITILTPRDWQASPEYNRGVLLVNPFGVDTWCISNYTSQKWLCALAKKKLELVSGSLEEKVEELRDKLVLENTYAALTVALRGLGQKLSRNSNKFAGRFADECYSLIQSEGVDDVYIGVDHNDSSTSAVLIYAPVDTFLSAMTRQYNRSIISADQKTAVVEAKFKTKRIETKDEESWFSIYFPKVDPWGQGSKKGEGNVTTSNDYGGLPLGSWKIK